MIYNVQAFIVANRAITNNWTFGLFRCLYGTLCTDVQTLCYYVPSLLLLYTISIIAKLFSYFHSLELPALNP